MSLRPLDLPYNMYKHLNASNKWKPIHARLTAITDQLTNHVLIAYPRPKTKPVDFQVCIFTIKYNAIHNKKRRW